MFKLNHSAFIPLTCHPSIRRAQLPSLVLIYLVTSEIIFLPILLQPSLLTGFLFRFYTDPCLTVQLCLGFMISLALYYIDPFTLSGTAGSFFSQEHCRRNREEAKLFGIYINYRSSRQNHLIIFKCSFSL